VATGDRVGIRPEDLSAGAHDQLLLRDANRDACGTSRERAPADLPGRPVRQLDAERLAVTRDVLKSLPDHQVVIVSCDRNYESWTDAIVDLDKARESAMRALD